jgi:hypothetical protein
VPPDDFVHPMSIDNVQIITDPSIQEYPPCVVEEEHPVPPLATKKKTTTFISMLPRRRTRSTRFSESAIGWKDMEQAIPILHPLSFMVDTGMVPQEPTDNVETVPQELVLTDTNVTQEPTAHVETDPQEPVLIDTSVTQEPTTKHAKDVPLSQLFAQIEQKIKNIENSRIAALITENDNLKAELKTLK